MQGTDQSIQVSKRSAIPALTGLRFFAAFFVCLSHAMTKIMPVSAYMIAWYYPLQRLSALGMTLFFVLSGFVIHYNYSASIVAHPTRGLYNFLIARFARLYPLFLCCFLLDLYSRFHVYALYPNLMDVLPYYLTLTQSWFYMLLNQHSLIYQFGVMTNVAWSVSTEWFFYLFYPLVCVALIKINSLRSKLIAIVFVCLCAIAWVAWLAINKEAINQYGIETFGMLTNVVNTSQDSFFRWLLYFSPYSRLAEFIMGCLLAAIYMQLDTQKPSKKEEVIGCCILIGALISLVIAYDNIFNPSPARGWLQHFHQCFGFAPSITVVIFCCARYTNFMTRFVANPWFLLGGEISYSIYLLHTEVIKYFRRFAVETLSWHEIAQDAVLLMIVLAVIFIIAYCSFRLIEVPARRFLRKQLMIGAGTKRLRTSS